jgi:hypothetical protein
MPFNNPKEEYTERRGKIAENNVIVLKGLMKELANPDIELSVAVVTKTDTGEVGVIFDKKNVDKVDLVTMLYKIADNANETLSLEQRKIITDRSGWGRKGEKDV